MPITKTTKKPENKELSFLKKAPFGSETSAHISDAYQEDNIDLSKVYQSWAEQQEFPNRLMTIEEYINTNFKLETLKVQKFDFKDNIQFVTTTPNSICNKNKNKDEKVEVEVEREGEGEREGEERNEKGIGIGKKELQLKGKDPGEVQSGTTTTTATANTNSPSSSNWVLNSSPITKNKHKVNRTRQMYSKKGNSARVGVNMIERSLTRMKQQNNDNNNIEEKNGKKQKSQNSCDEREKLEEEECLKNKTMEKEEQKEGERKSYHDHDYENCLKDQQEVYKIDDNDVDDVKVTPLDNLPEENNNNNDDEDEMFYSYAENLKRMASSNNNEDDKSHNDDVKDFINKELNYDIDDDERNIKKLESYLLNYSHRCCLYSNPRSEEQSNVSSSFRASSSISSSFVPFHHKYNGENDNIKVTGSPNINPNYSVPINKTDYQQQNLLLASQQNKRKLKSSSRTLSSCTDRFTSLFFVNQDHPNDCHASTSSVTCSTTFQPKLSYRKLINEPKIRLSVEKKKRKTLNLGKKYKDRATEGEEKMNNMGKDRDRERNTQQNQHRRTSSAYDKQHQNAYAKPQQPVTARLGFRGEMVRPYSSFCSYANEKQPIKVIEAALLKNSEVRGVQNDGNTEDGSKNNNNCGNLNFKNRNRTIPAQHSTVPYMNFNFKYILDERKRKKKVKDECKSLSRSKNGDEVYPHDDLQPQRFKKGSNSGYFACFSSDRFTKELTSKYLSY